MVTIVPLDGAAVDEAAHLVAREDAQVRSHRPHLPLRYSEPGHCQQTLTDLLANEFRGFLAREQRRCVGVMCGRTIDGVGVIPAHGLAVDPEDADPTAVMVGLFAETAPLLLADGASRFTIDHVALDSVGAALNNLGFGRGSVFASQPARRVQQHMSIVDVRVGSFRDLDAIAALSHLEFSHRSTPPIFAYLPTRTLADTRARHEALLEQGALHLLARHDSEDVGLLTVEFTSPAPRLCPNGQPYIGSTAAHPSVRGRGVGHALVHHVLDWAHSNGFHTVSVDFESANPLSRPFWLGLRFKPTGYRVRRTIDAVYLDTKPVGGAQHP
jgi:GNAT superfamily N-acetyltransferase